MLHERFIESADGTALYTSSTGTGPAVVLCDGIGCDGFIWRYLRPALAAHFRVISWHYRGHGRSEAPTHLHDMSVPVLARDLRAVLDAYAVPQAILLGHSLGAQLILHFALTDPARVRALVPICGSYGRPLDTLRGDGRLARAFPVLRDTVLRWPRRGQQIWQGLLASKIAYAVAARFEVNGRVVQAADFKPYFDHLANMSAQVFVSLLDQVQHHSVEDRLIDIRAPTLVIAGERDTLTPAWLSQRMQRLVPGAEILIVPGGSHVAPIEIPELIYLRLERFLAERVLGGGLAPGVASPPPAATLPQLAASEPPPVDAALVRQAEAAPA